MNTPQRKNTLAKMGPRKTPLRELAPYACARGYNTSAVNAVLHMLGVVWVTREEASIFRYISLFCILAIVDLFLLAFFILRSLRVAHAHLWGRLARSCPQEVLVQLCCLLASDPGVLTE